MKQLTITAIAILIANPAFATPRNHHPQPTPATASATANPINNTNSSANSSSNSSASTTNSNSYRPATTNSNTTNIDYPQVVPNIAGPVPRGYVPVLSVYGQLDHEQRGVYGAQISIPLAR